MPEFDLEDLRFVGFVRFGDLSREDSLIPTDSGVYVLVADAIQPELPRVPQGGGRARPIAYSTLLNTPRYRSGTSRNR